MPALLQAHHQDTRGPGYNDYYIKEEGRTEVLPTGVMEGRTELLPDYSDRTKEEDRTEFLPTGVLKGRT